MAKNEHLGQKVINQNVPPLGKILVSRQEALCYI